MKKYYRNIFIYVNYDLPLRKQYNFYLLMSKLMKYKILELKKDKGVTFIKLATICQVTERQMINWCKIEEDSFTSIPSDKLRLLSNFFGCTMEQLFTNKLVTV